MNSVLDTQSIASLNRIQDEDAARLVSAQALAELEAAITATPAAPARARRIVPRLPRRPLLVLAAAATLSAVVLGVSGALSGGGPAEVQPADAAVLRGALAALRPPGSIVIESYHSVQRTDNRLLQFAPGYRPRSRIDVGRFAGREIIETPHGNGPQNMVNLGDPSFARGVQVGEVNGNQELYDPASNTVYISSDYGADITAGKRPGTFVYTLPKVPNARPGSADAYANAHRPPPLTISAAQAKALRDGTAMVNTEPNKGRAGSHVTIIPAFRVPDDIAKIRLQLRAGKLEPAGVTTVEGRRAIRLVAVHGRDEYDVAPGTYVPIRTVLAYGPAITVTTIYDEYRILPATPANERLLDLAFRHPGARIDRSHADYVAAQARLTGS